MRRVDGLVAAGWALAWLAGCGDDQSNNPPARRDVSPEMALEASLAAAEFVDDLVSSLGDVIEGDLTASFDAANPPDGPSDFPRGEEPPCQRHWTGSAWTASCAGTADSGPVATWVFVQFTDAAGQPQQQRDAMTRAITHRVDRTVERLETDPRGSGDLFDYAFDFTNDLTLAVQQPDAYAAIGSGAMHWTFQRMRGGETSREDMAASWTHDLLVPTAGGCTTGTFEISVGAYEAVGVYGPDGRYSLIVYRDRETIHSRERVSGCG